MHPPPKLKDENEKKKAAVYSLPSNSYSARNNYSKHPKKGLHTRRPKICNMKVSQWAVKTVVLCILYATNTLSK